VPPEALLALAKSPAAHGFAFVLGALLGSFANVVIHRLPRGESIVRPPSHCTACGAPVRWFDNLPIVSYLVLRGRCRRCGARYSSRYLLVEAATGLLVLAVYHLCVSLAPPLVEELPMSLARFAVYTLFVWTLVVVTFIDLDTKKILDKVTYPAIPTFFACAVLLGDVPLLELVIGAAAGYLGVRLLSDGYYLLTRREGLGYGDGKLLSVVGALLGWRGVLFSLFGGALLGTLLILPALLARRLRDRGADVRTVEIPFGPFLAAAAVAYLFLAPFVRVGLAW
jgi:leader peptidase (prepilin peptidase)/N-methyltransferase